MLLSEIKLEKDDQNNLKLVLPSNTKEEVYLTSYNFGLICLALKHSLSQAQWSQVVEEIKDL